MEEDSNEEMKIEHALRRCQDLNAVVNIEKVWKKEMQEVVPEDLNSLNTIEENAMSAK